MKDSYSFDVDDAGLDRSYAAHRDAYIKIFDRLGLDYVIVSAMSGAMGGSKSEEFLHPTAIGEDTFVRSPGGYAANVEAVTTVVPDAIPLDGLPEAHVEDTPDTPTIETLVAVAQQLFPDAGYTAASTLKNVVVTLVHPDGTREPLVIGLPGDREVDAKRLEAQVAPAEVEPFTDFDKHPGAGEGLHRPAGARQRRASRRSATWSTRASSPAPAGSPAPTSPASTCSTSSPAATSPGTASSRPPRCAPATRRPTARARWSSPAAWRSGHIFQLGRKYAEALDLKVLDENGKLVTVTMGSYGIGVSRAVAAIAESNHDELGLVWPREVAPGRRARRRHRQGRRGLRGGRGAGRRAGRRRAHRALRRPAEGVARREVQGRRAARDADDRDRRPRAGRGHDRGPRPGDRRARGGARSPRPRRRVLAAVRG